MNSINENWLRERKTYIGGSDIAAISGLNPYKNSLQIYLEKTRNDITPRELSEAALWGNILEEPVAQEYSKRTGFNVEVEPNVLRHPDYPFIAANIDRWANNKKHVLECKTAGFFQGKEWGLKGSDHIPENYLCQVAYYAAICNVPVVDIAVLIGGQDFRIYTYYRDQELETKLIKIAFNFWNDHILKEVPPEASGFSNTSLLYTIGNGLEINSNDLIKNKIDALKDLKLQQKMLSEEMETIICEIKDYMKEYDTLVDNDGKCLATWKNSSPKTVVDFKRLQEEHYDLYIQYTKENKGSRTFLIK